MTRVNTRPMQSLQTQVRLLEYALAESPDVGAAFTRLRDAASPIDREAVNRLEQLILDPVAESPALVGVGPSPYRAFARLLAKLTVQQRASSALVRALHQQQSFAAATVMTVWSQFMGYLMYLAAVIGLLAAVTVVYTVFVMPQMRGIYESVGFPLPQLTRAVFGGGAWLVVLLIVLGCLAIGANGWFVVKLRAQLQRFAPLAGAYRRMPLLGAVADYYNEYLWLSYSAVLSAGGLAAEASLRAAADEVPGVVAIDQISDVSLSSPHGALQAAARLGHLGDELRAQQDEAATRFLQSLAKARRDSRLVLTIWVYVLVALLVIAMYLPIFKMGNTI
jgi:hypothetical protein